ncbi:MAG: sensor histidine kinase [Thermomicrobiales bacterium]
MIDDLLLLGRAQDRELPRSRQPADLAPMAADQITAPESRWPEQEIGFGFDHAVRSSPQGGSVTIRACRAEGMIHLTVRDEGIGILDNGPGLAIAREIVTRNDGRIWAERRHGEGSTIHLVLPPA